MIDLHIDLGVIGGSGFYAFEGLVVEGEHRIDTPYGAPSDAVVVGRLGAARLAFLARHAQGHKLAPHRVNYRANIWALREFGVRRIIAANAVGGITEGLGPRALCVPDQIIDYTHGRLSSFCDVDAPDEVTHIDFTEPYTADLRARLVEAAAGLGIALRDGGVHGVTQGPRLETMAEIVRMARDGCDLVGMTGMPEAALAREAGIDYACIAMVANWAAGCSEAGVGVGAPPISIDEIFAHLGHATAEARRIIAAVAAGVAAEQSG